mgnify:CR=1 FL=1
MICITNGHKRKEEYNISSKEYIDVVFSLSKEIKRHKLSSPVKVSIYDNGYALSYAKGTLNKVVNGVNLYLYQCAVYFINGHEVYYKYYEDGNTTSIKKDFKIHSTGKYLLDRENEVTLYTVQKWVDKESDTNNMIAFKYKDGALVEESEYVFS